MTIYRGNIGAGAAAGGGGETRDALIEDCMGAGLAIISTPVKSGVGALQVPAGVAAYGTLIDVSNFVNTSIISMQAYFNFDGNPNAIVPIFGPTSTDRTGAYIVEANATTRTLRICAVGTNGDYATRTPLTPWSEAAIPSGSYDTGPVVFIIDPLSVNTDHVWLRLFVNNVEVFSFDAGVWPIAMSNEQYGISTYGVAPSVALRIDDAVGLITTSAADAPHLAAWPIAKVDAQHPISDTGGTVGEWVRNSGTADYYTYWDDATGNDGDTTYLSSAQTAKTNTSAMESLATLGWNASATVFEYKYPSTGIIYGPVLSCVHRTVGGTKFEGFGTTNLTTDQNVTDPGSTYVGRVDQLIRSPYTAWTRADAGTIIPGFKTGTNDRDWRVTLMMLQWTICDNEFLPLAGAPMIPQGGMF
jgi:hypothetical protein